MVTGLLPPPPPPVGGVAWVAPQVTDEQLERDAEEGKIGEEEQRRSEKDSFERLAVAQALAQEGGEIRWLSAEPRNSGARTASCVSAWTASSA